MPTQIIRGNRSPAPIRRIAELLATHLPLSRLATVVGAGHILPATHPAPVHALITKHIRANLGRHRRAA